MASEKQILLVEDDKFIVDAYSTRLKKAGYHVVVASNGEEALEKIKDRRPDLILLDLIMPVMSGFDFLETLRNDTVCKDCPVVVLTNLSQQADEDRCRKLGVKDFVVKADSSFSEVTNMVDKYL